MYLQYQLPPPLLKLFKCTILPFGFIVQQAEEQFHVIGGPCARVLCEA